MNMKNVIDYELVHLKCLDESNGTANEVVTSWQSQILWCQFGDTNVSSCCFSILHRRNSMESEKANGKKRITEKFEDLCCLVKRLWKDADSLAPSWFKVYSFIDQFANVPSTFIQLSIEILTLGWIIQWIEFICQCFAAVVIDHSVSMATISLNVILNCFLNYMYIYNI